MPESLNPTMDVRIASNAVIKYLQCLMNIDSAEGVVRGTRIIGRLHTWDVAKWVCNLLEGFSNDTFSHVCEVKCYRDNVYQFYSYLNNLLVTVYLDELNRLERLSILTESGYLLYVPLLEM